MRIHIFDLPKPIQDELKVWEKACKKIKNHPLAELKSHENFGYDPNSPVKYNSYQCGIPSHLVEDSFWLAFTLRKCAETFGGNHRNYFLRKWQGHFDGYDIWANFAYKGNENPVHSHAGNLSGVIYHKNHNHPTYFPDDNFKYDGKNGTMVIFPSDVNHYVEKQVSSQERITFAFNLFVMK